MQFYDFGKYRIDVANRELLLDGKHIPLTQKCFEILLFLIENRDRMLKKDEILNVVWTENFVEEANLAQHIYMIRKVLKENGDERNYIETIPKFGYRFIGEVKEISARDLAATNFPNQSVNAFYVNGNSNGSFPNQLTSPDKDETQEKIALPSRKKTLSLFSTIAIALILFSLFSFVGYKLYSNYNSAPQTAQFDSIAILPFNQIGGAKNEKLGLGIADTLISKLSNQKEVSIAPTSSIIQYLEEAQDNPIKVGEKLRTDYVLTGTIQKDHNIVRVNVQLIDVKKKVPVWSEKFDAEFSDMFTLQDKVFEHVANRLSIKTNEASEFIAENKHTDNFEAYQAYTMGLFHWDERTEQSLSKAAEYFEKAIEKDPKYAIAHALLADTYSLMVFFNLGHLPKDEYIAKAKQMGNRALELNPKSSEALTALALISLYEENTNKAFYLYKKAIEINPNNANARQRYAWMLTYNNNLEDAIKEMKFAQRTRPSSRLANTNLAYFLYLDKKPEEALAFCKKAIEISPSVPETRIMLAQIYEQMGEHDKAIGELEKTSKEPELRKTSLTILSRIQAKQGNKKKAIKTLKEATKKPETTNLDYETATAYLHIGDKKQAVKILSESKDKDLTLFTKIAHDYNLDPLRKMPEFNQIMSKIQSRGDEKKKEKSEDDGA